MTSDGSDTSGYVAMADDLRRFLDAVAAARPDAAGVAALRRDIQAWTAALGAVAVPEAQQLFGRQSDAPGRGQTMAPAFATHARDRNSMAGTVSFGRYFLGGNSAAHGGAIALLFDDVLGRLAGVDRPRARTAYLHVDYRAVTPLDVTLDVRAWFVSEQGRKRVLRGELRHGEIVCAEAEALFVQLRPGQP